MRVNRTFFNKWSNDYDNYLPKIPQHNKLLKTMLQKAKIKDKHDVLDIGIGTGYAEFNLLKNRGCKIVGMDVSDKMLNITRMKNKKKKLNLKLIRQNAKNINFKQNSFDVIFSCFTLHHLTDKEKQNAFKKIHSILRKKGRFVLADMVVDSPLNTKKRLKEILDTWGFIALNSYDYTGNYGLKVEFNAIHDVYFQNGEFETSRKNLKKFFVKAGFRNIKSQFVNKKFNQFLIWGEK